MNIRLSLRHREQGLTLVEIVAVIVIIGLIMSVVAPRIFKQSGVAKAQLNIVRMDQIKMALGNYKLMFNNYPSTLSGLIKPSAEIKSSGKLFAPLLEDKDLEDIWGVPYIYKAKNNNRSYSLTSLGEDGMTGGEGPDQDISVGP